jgi:hypothetical protein
MILTDSSVWINHINHVVDGPVIRLRELLTRRPLSIGDLTLCETLRGFPSEAQARLTARILGRFEMISLCSPELAIKAAANYRFLDPAALPSAKPST